MLSVLRCSSFVAGATHLAGPAIEYLLQLVSPCAGARVWGRRLGYGAVSVVQSGGFCKKCCTCWQTLLVVFMVTTMVCRPTM